MIKFEALREKLEVGKILSFEEMDIIKKELELTKENLQEIRNQTVMYAADKLSDARHEQNYEKYKSYENTMSKITTTIDYIRGF